MLVLSPNYGAKFWEVADGQDDVQDQDESARQLQCGIGPFFETHTHTFNKYHRTFDDHSGQPRQCQLCCNWINGPDQPCK